MSESFRGFPKEFETAKTCFSSIANEEEYRGPTDIRYNSLTPEQKIVFLELFGYGKEEEPIYNDCMNWNIILVYITNILSKK